MFTWLRSRLLIGWSFVTEVSKQLSAAESRQFGASSIIRQSHILFLSDNLNHFALLDFTLRANPVHNHRDIFAVPKVQPFTLPYNVNDCAFAVLDLEYLIFTHFLLLEFECILSVILNRPDFIHELFGWYQVHHLALFWFLPTQLVC